MSGSAKLSSLGLALAILAVNCVPAHAAAGYGVVRGVVRDQAGTPLVGAMVAIFDATSKADTPLRNTATDAKGYFEAHVAPGRYLLRAVASGFSAFEMRARVAANRETVVDAIALRRANTLADRRRATDRNPYRQVARGSRGHVFQWEDAPEQEPEEADAQALALTERENAMHGVVQTVAATGASNYVATNFAIARHAKATDVTVVGQTGVGPDAPLRLEVTTATDIGDDHEATVAIGFGRLRLDGTGHDTLEPLDQYTLQAVDRWQALDRLVIVYGLNYTRFGGASDASAVLPRFGVEFAPDPRTQVFARLTPASAMQEIASFDLETGEVTFVEPSRAAVPAERAGEATPDRSRRFEVGFGRLIDERSNFEVMAFYDVASGRGIGFLAVPNPGQGAEFRTGALDGPTSGVRVLYTRRFSDLLTGSFGYAAGRGLEVDPQGLSNPASLFRPANFHVVATQLQADFDTGTRITAVYRFSPSRVVFAIDPFAGRLAAHEPSASIFVAQSLPLPDFFPGEWEATLDVRNLFFAAPTGDDRELTLVEFNRLVRAGLSFRF
jgi:hypothetical protein